ncbi:HAMP domain-containing sensor histidine kinase [Anaeromicropila herbilytica]|uniref:histidine kinase n=1 Tax=Anaeromicropila herbilytica TaxID=2785025 RepID=A0A7R7IBH2_9FIRM|nr:HAMP domain-containing sensor histidine kinase [Anaeromicropila herbilytica]BCN28761.1 two-component sensor histidine kinase [Anaeromicropila herbilytica]
MKLKSKLMIVFVTVIFFPIILISAAGGVIFSYQVNSIEHVYDVQSEKLQVITNPIQILNRITRGVYNEIKLRALKSPDKFEDRNYLDDLNSQLKRKYSFLAVRKGDYFVYYGNRDKLDKIKINLPKFGVYNTDVDGGLYVGGKNPFLVKQQDFYYTDGSEGTIFVITDVDTIVPQLKSTAIQFCLAFFTIILFTGSLLILWIYKGIISPLNTLRIATNKMKEGNLNFSIESESCDEIGQLCDDFEDMRKRLKELIEVRMQYEVETRELISNISHDLKTPLTAIKGYSEGIIDGVADSKEKMDKYVRTIYQKANDMTSLVDELSFYSKIDCDTMPYTFTNINLYKYFNDCIEDLSLDLEVKNIDIEYTNDTDPTLKVAADVEQLKRVISNIIGNSVKYIGNKKGLIQVRISDDGDSIRVEIQDNGKGIGKEDLPYIFDRFYRTDSSRNSSQGGSGLGLSIAKKIIEEHCGTIWADSVEGEGTTIYFTLKKVVKEQEEGNE